MLSKWEQSDDLRSYRATTTYTVYEVNLSEQGAGWILRRRKRAWDGHDDEWTVLAAVRSPEVAFKLAQYDVEHEDH